MNQNFLFIILSLSVILVSYMTYNINKFMGNSLELKEVNTNNKMCHIIDTETTIEDIVKINDQFIIGSGFRGLEVFSILSYTKYYVKNDNLFLLNTISQKVTKLTINNYPKGIPFHPHGLDLYKINNEEYLLYIVNHAVNFNYLGEERIDRIKINFDKISKEPSLEYKNSIILPQNFFLRVNSVAAVDQNIFYFSTYSPFYSPFNIQELSTFLGKMKYKFFGYLKSLLIMLNIKKCFIYSYNGKEINQIIGSESLFNNGISFDKKRNYLYVIRTMEKDMNIFEIDKNNKNNAKLIKTVPILYIGDNVFYDEYLDKLYIGFSGKFSENTMIKEAYLKNGNFDSVNAYSGYEEINPDGDYSISELMVIKNTFRGISSAVVANNIVYMVSIYTKGFYVCSN